MNLQYSAMGSMGTRWIGCQDRYAKFIGNAVFHTGHTVARVESDLLSGLEVKTGPLWDDASIRDADSIAAPVEPVDTRTRETCSCCGQTGYINEYPFSTLSGGDICDDCV